jgi:CRP/FNR family cyclic AMP-dependent transcriptional regulator
VRRAASSGVTVCSLAAHGFLRGMPEGMLAELVPAASLVEVPAGRRLFEDGGHAAHFWLIRSGSVALDLHVPGRGWELS